MEQKVLGIIGQVCVRGITGDIDSGATDAANSKDVDGMHINKPCRENKYWSSWPGWTEAGLQLCIAATKSLSYIKTRKKII